MDPGSAVLVALLLCGGILAGVALSVAGQITAARRIAKSRAWPTTEGVVVESDIRAVSVPLGTLWRPRLRYGWRVDGQTYTGEVVTWADDEVLYPEDEARRIAGRYRTGDRLTVHYDPDDPATGVLDPSRVPLAARRRLFRTIGLAVVAILIIVAALAASG